MKDKLSLTLYIFAELNKAENAILIYKQSVPLFLARLEQSGISAQHINYIGNPRDKFVFVNDGQAEQLFNAWKD